MRSRSTLMATCLAILALSAGGAARTAESEKSLIGQLSWLAGCWQRTGADRHTEEQWMAPRGGVMLGMSRTVVGGALREYEFLMIQEEDGQLVLTARPSGQEGAVFRSIEVTPSRVVFSNPDHDFPQRIIYQRADDGSLEASIEGETPSGVRQVDFPMQRARCPDGD